MWSVKLKSPQPALHCQLTTPRLELRPAREEDYGAWHRVRTLNECYLRTFEPAWPKDCLSEAFFQRRISRITQDWLADRGYSFLIFDSARRDLIGGININNVSRGAAQYASLGYWLDESSQGKGYMTEAAQGILDYAFSILSLHRMNAATLPYNHKSRAMLLRVGFTEEGFAKNYIQINGRRQDHVLYGMNADDFLRAARNAR